MYVCLCSLSNGCAQYRAFAAASHSQGNQHLNTTSTHSNLPSLLPTPLHAFPAADTQDTSTHTNLSPRGGGNGEGGVKSNVVATTTPHLSPRRPPGQNHSHTSSSTQANGPGRGLEESLGGLFTARKVRLVSNVCISVCVYACM
jgi:hypothetical protein